MKSPDFEKPSRRIIPDNGGYGQFLASLQYVPKEIVDDSVVRQQISIAQDESLDPEERFAAKNAIRNTFIRFIPAAIKTSNKNKYPQEELVGEMFEVLDSAINNFDLNAINDETGKPSQFSAYIWSSLILKLKSPKTVEDPRQSVHLPARATEILPRARNAYRVLITDNPIDHLDRHRWYERTNELLMESGKKPIKEDVFKAIVQFGIGNPFVSLDVLVENEQEEIDDNDSIEMRYRKFPVLHPDTQPRNQPETQSIRSVERQELEKLIASTLSPRQQQVIQLKFGLGCNSDDDRRSAGLNDTEIAKLLGVSRQATDHHTQTALEKLLKAYRASSLPKLETQKSHDAQIPIFTINAKATKIRDIFIEPLKEDKNALLQFEHSHEYHYATSYRQLALDIFSGRSSEYIGIPMELKYELVGQIFKIPVPDSSTRYTKKTEGLLKIMDDMFSFVSPQFYEPLRLYYGLDNPRRRGMNYRQIGETLQPPIKGPKAKQLIDSGFQLLRQPQVSLPLAQFLDEL